MKRRSVSESSDQGFDKSFAVTAYLSRTPAGWIARVHGPAPPSEQKSQPLY